MLNIYGDIIGERILCLLLVLGIFVQVIIFKPLYLFLFKHLAVLH
jgi:hypothetical protein